MIMFVNITQVTLISQALDRYIHREDTNLSNSCAVLVVLHVGTIPKEIGTLAALTDLRFGNTKFEGSF